MKKRPALLVQESIAHRVPIARFFKKGDIKITHSSYFSQIIRKLFL